MDQKSALPPSVLRSEKAIQEIVQYYTEIGPDYWQWSKSFNMHFGYYRMGMNPFDLESMLRQMNQEIIRRLALDHEKPLRILDLGCGLGATARQLTAALPHAQVSGITIVPWQARRASELTQHHLAADRVEFLVGDYTALPFGSSTFDGVYALESSCYAPGSDKAGLLQEMW